MRIFRIVFLLVVLLVFITWASPSQAQTIEKLIAGVLISHPSTQSQRSLVAAAASGVESARWQFYPTPAVSIESAEHSSSDALYQGDKQVTTLRLQQPLWTGGRLTAGIDKAKAGLDQSQFAFDEVRQQLSLKVVQYYGEWMAAHLKSQATYKSLVTHTRLRDQIRRRIAEGASPESDLTLAMSRLDSIAAELIASRAQRDISVGRLGQLLGRPLDGSTLAEPIATPRELTDTLQVLLDNAILLSPAIQKTKAQANIQMAQIAERRSELSPEVYARLERQYGNFNFANGRPETRFFFGVSSRFGAGLSSLVNVDAAQKQHEAALAEIDVQSRIVSEQVLADHALAASLNSRLAAVKASLHSNELVADSFDRQFLAGRKTWLDVMNAARELAQSESQLADLLSTQVSVTWRVHLYTKSMDAVLQSPQ